MAPKPVKPWTVVFGREDWERLNAHHLRDDGEEHGSVLVCGVVETERERRLLVREVLLARDGVDYIARRGTYRLVADFVSEKSGYCADQKLAYVAVHNHPIGDAVRFSQVDLESHERGYPALLDITRGGPVGALVLAGKAVAGDIWTPSDRAPVARTIVLGARRELFFPAPPRDAGVWSAVDDRQARIFGREGQALLSTLKIVIVGAGGAGSLLVQALVHLGVGELVVIDDDIVKQENLRRIVGSVPADAEMLPRKGAQKVEVARRVAASVNPFLLFRPVDGNVVDRSEARWLVDADAAFLAADSMQARHVFNAICHQYLVPGFQVGAKVHAPGGHVQDAFAVSRIVGPGATCMWCSDLISRERLQKEAFSEEERRAINYVPDVVAPSVITMNAMSTALALNDFLFTFTGLHRTNELGPRRYDFLTREPVIETLPMKTCAQCEGRKAKGDRGDLPLRLRAT